MWAVASSFYSRRKQNRQERLYGCVTNVPACSLSVTVWLGCQNLPATFLTASPLACPAYPCVPHPGPQSCTFSSLLGP